MNISMKSTKKFQTGPVNYIFVLCVSLKMGGSDPPRLLIDEARAVGHEGVLDRLSQSQGQLVKKVFERSAAKWRRACLKVGKADE
jgi:hypothetical protein